MDISIIIHRTRKDWLEGRLWTRNLNKSPKFFYFFRYCYQKLHQIN